MRRTALIFASGTLAFGATVASFYAASFFLAAVAMQFRHGVYNVTWLK